MTRNTKNELTHDGTIETNDMKFIEVQKHIERQWKIDKKYIEMQ